jgi:hypothetical protein
LKLISNDKSAKIKSAIDSYKISVITSGDYTDIDFTDNVQIVSLRMEPSHSTRRFAFQPKKMYQFKSISIFECHGDLWLEQINSIRFPKLQRLVVPIFEPLGELQDSLLVDMFRRNPNLIFLRFVAKSISFCQEMEKYYSGKLKVTYFDRFSEAERVQ